MLNITVTKSSLKNLKSDLLVMPFTVKELKRDAEKAFEAFGLDKGALKDFKGKSGDSLVLYSGGSKLKAPRVLLLGLGEMSEAEDLRKSATAVARHIKSLRVKNLVLDCSSVSSWAHSIKESTSMMAELFVDSILYGLYSFDRLKSGKLEKKKGKEKEEKARIGELKIRVNAGNVKDVEDGVRSGRIIADARCLARDLVNLPGNLLNAEDIAEAARNSAEKSGCKVTVFHKEEIEELGMGGLQAVNKGSYAPPTFTVLEYEPADQPVATVALVGKGVTFDSGGISLKPSSAMDEMKCDMAGAASVIGTVEAVALLGLPLRVIGFIPATDNMPGGAAQTPGDVITTYSGITVEVGNTDAEGRLILADALSYAVRKYEPDAVIDLATLTGACIVSLGYSVAGLFSNNDKFAGKIYEAGRKSGEKVWRMPTWVEYDELIKSEVADVHNAGAKGAGSITAAKFLEKFINGHKTWAHLDIAGPAFSAKKGKTIPGGTGFGVRLLVDLLRDWE
ncbi:leucyl aminopeptidase [Prosthecochloris sp.]|uniref:leucyl aminopeptidase n=1 Tax=Prosthecochloris sp. TaxID=290513 RepID=UPI00257F765A|nr:leucyl aminopeptidase [Prosthecochloris sp.]